MTIALAESLKIEYYACEKVLGKIVNTEVTYCASSFAKPWQLKIGNVLKLYISRTKLKINIPLPGTNEYMYIIS